MSNDIVRFHQRYRQIFPQFFHFTITKIILIISKVNSLPRIIQIMNANAVFSSILYIVLLSLRGTRQRNKNAYLIGSSKTASDDIPRSLKTFSSIQLLFFDQKLSVFSAMEAGAPVMGIWHYLGFFACLFIRTANSVTKRIMDHFNG